MAPRMGLAQSIKKLVPDAIMASDQFGRAVSISGNTLIIGANFHDDIAEDAGAAFVYEKEGADWNLSDTIVLTEGSDSDGFGFSVAVDGDFAIIGALGDDEKGINAGAAYIFFRDGAAWSLQSKLTANDGTANDAFGFSVAISGDLALVGARGADEQGNSSGAAYLFVRSNTGWVQLNKLMPINGTGGDFFGTSVALNQNYAVIGALLANGFDDNSGAAYVFENRGAIWLEAGTLIADDGRSLDQFGVSVALSGDLIVVGARSNDDKALEAGAAYVFRKQDDGFAQVDKLLAIDGVGNDAFGQSVSLGDSYIVVGAPGDDDAGSSAGAAYLYEEKNGAWLQVAKLRPEENLTNGGMGVAVAASGTQTVAGAWGSEGEEIVHGAAFVFDLSTVLTDLDVEPFISSRLLKQFAAYPNPFVGSVSIEAVLASAGWAKIVVQDVRGLEIAVLFDGYAVEGRTEVSWDGKGRDAKPQPAGLYFLSVITREGKRSIGVVKIQ
ncbi:MAG: FG-GAP repeat protein [Rhodothermales bacterium]